MARSSDPRRPTPFQRGSKRYHSVGGHVPPGDEVENTRDHERIWFELKKTRGCCGCEHPGLKYCFEQADYPTLVCEGLFPPDTATLIDYYPGTEAAPDGISLAQGCGGGGSTQWSAGGDAIFYPDGSWRNGPTFIGNGGAGHFLGTGTGWNNNLFMEASWSFEFFIKPSSTDMALQSWITGCGNFGLGNPYTFGGFVTAFAAGGAIQVGQEQYGFTASAPNFITADEWHHIVYTYDGGDTGAFSIYVNGRRAVLTLFPPDTLVYDNSVMMEIRFGNGSLTSDVSRYSGLMPASEIRRRARIMLGIVGLDGGEDEEGGDGTIVDDPTFLIDDLGPDQIDGEDLAGYVMMSAGETAYWESPEASPFELEARKGVADGYAELDSAVHVPVAQLGSGTPNTGVKYLRDDGVWAELEDIVPFPTEIGQMLRAEPSPSAAYLAQIASVFGDYEHYPLTDAADPFLSTTAAAWGQLNISSGAPAVDPTTDEVFFGETVVLLDAGDGLTSASSPDTDIGRCLISFWLKVTELPAANENIVRVATYLEVQLRADGKLDWEVNGVLRVTTTTALTPGVWYHIVAANDGAGLNTGSKVWINGVAEGTGGSAFGSAFSNIVVGGEDARFSIAHLSIIGTEYANGLTDADVLSIYETRQPVWTLVDDVGTGGGGGGVSDREVEILCTNPGGADLTVGDGVGFWLVPESMDGWNLTAVLGGVTTFSAAGAVTVQIRNVTEGVDVLSTPITIDAGEYNSLTAATPPAITFANRDIAAGDLIAVDIDGAGSGAKGLIVVLKYEPPA